MPIRAIKRVLSSMIALLCACEPRDTSAPHAAVSSDTIAARIEAAVSILRRDTATVLELSAEGATLDAAYRDTSLQRLRAIYLGEMGRATETFYFDSTLFLVVRGEVRYDMPLSGRVADSSTKRIDLRVSTASTVVRDSLRNEVRLLLEHLAAARR